MSVIKKAMDDLLYPAALKPILLSYLPSDLFKTFTFTESGGITCFDDRVKYYGNDQAFLDCVQNYTRFAGSLSHFNMDFATPYTVLPVVCQGTSGSYFIYKQDNIVSLQHVTKISSTFNRTENYFIFSVIGYYLKTKENVLNGISFEFVPVDSETLGAFALVTKEKMNKIMKNRKAPDPVPKITFEAVFEKLTEILPQNEKDPTYMQIFQLLEKQDLEKPVKKNFLLYWDLLLLLECLLKEIGQFMDCHPDWYLPGVTTMTKKIVRVFVDDGKRMVMGTDILSFVTEESKIYINENAEQGIFVAIRFEDFQNEVGNTNIEFLPTPIVRSKNRSIFIPSINGKYCILASDLLWETLIDLISFKGVFQNINERNFGIVQSFFKEAEKTVFSCDVPGTYFVSTELSQRLKERCDRHFDKHMGRLFKKYQPVRGVSSHGFTLKDLKHEICNIGLMDSAFSSSMDEYAERVFKQYKIESTNLKDIHMYEALEEIQKMCVLRNIPKLNRFIHIQGACTRNPFNCEYCFGSKMAVKFPKMPILLNKTKMESEETIDQVHSEKAEIEEEQEIAQTAAKPEETVSPLTAKKLDIEKVEKDISDEPKVDMADQMPVEALRHEEKQEKKKTVVEPNPDDEPVEQRPVDKLEIEENEEQQRTSTKSDSGSIEQKSVEELNTENEEKEDVLQDVAQEEDSEVQQNVERPDELQSDRLQKVMHQEEIQQEMAQKEVEVVEEEKMVVQEGILHQEVTKQDVELHDVGPQEPEVIYQEKVQEEVVQQEVANEEKMVVEENIIQPNQIQEDMVQQEQMKVQQEEKEQEKQEEVMDVAQPVQLQDKVEQQDAVRQEMKEQNIIHPEMSQGGVLQPDNVYQETIHENVEQRDLAQEEKIVVQEDAEQQKVEVIQAKQDVEHQETEVLVQKDAVVEEVVQQKQVQQKETMKQQEDTLQEVLKNVKDRKNAQEDVIKPETEDEEKMKVQEDVVQPVDKQDLVLFEKEGMKAQEDTALQNAVKQEEKMFIHETVVQQEVVQQDEGHQQMVQKEEEEAQEEHMNVQEDVVNQPDKQVLATQENEQQKVEHAEEVVQVQKKVQHEKAEEDKDMKVQQDLLKQDVEHLEMEKEDVIQQEVTQEANLVIKDDVVQRKMAQQYEVLDEAEEDVIHQETIQTEEKEEMQGGDVTVQQEAEQKSTQQKVIGQDLMSPEAIKQEEEHRNLEQKLVEQQDAEHQEVIQWEAIMEQHVQPKKANQEMEQQKAVQPKVMEERDQEEQEIMQQDVVQPEVPPVIKQEKNDQVVVPEEPTVPEENYDDLLRETQELARRIEQSEKKEKEKNDEIKRLNARVADLKTIKDSRAVPGENYEDLLRGTQELARRIKESEKKEKEKNAEIERLKARVAELKAIKDLRVVPEENYENLLRETEELPRRIEESEKKEKEKNSEIERLKEHVADLKLVMRHYEQRQ